LGKTVNAGANASAARSAATAVLASGTKSVTAGPVANHSFDADPTLSDSITDSSPPERLPKKARGRTLPGAAKQAELTKTSARSSGARPKARAARQAPVRIFQIYFEAWQRDLLDPAFVPFDNCGVQSELLEFDVFERLAKDKRTGGAELWGALSWRYAEKTGISGAELLAKIKKNPGHDVYYCNPHVANEALYHNMWMQGETAHPHFLELCSAVFKAAGIPDDELTSIQPSSAYSTANYFIGTSKFWALYIGFVRAVLAAADKNLLPEMKSLLHSTGADDRGLHGGATYVPFIVERLFTVFIRSVGRDLSKFKVDLPTSYSDLNVHLKLLREMKDVAHRTNSPWLAACWVNYRTLYLTQLHGKGWCQKYLRTITPTSVKFG
jgi:hypothetical protein